MQTGYPRFFIHLTIKELERQIIQRYGKSTEMVMLFPSQATARRCQRFLYDKIDSLTSNDVRIMHLEPKIESTSSPDPHQPIVSPLFCVFFPQECFPVAKQVWQHTGDGISSRRAEFCLQLLNEGLLQPVDQPLKPKLEDQLFTKGPRRYQRDTSQNGIVYEAAAPDRSTNGKANHLQTPEGKEYAQFVEERFGRNLSPALASQAKLAMRRRIAGCLVDNTDLDHALETSEDCSSTRVSNLTSDDVYLFPTGMSAIFNVHRILLSTAPTPLESICFGFPYVDTLKILEKWGPGALFYGHGTSSDLDDLESRLQSGERYLALFTEFPSNPLLRTPDLTRIRALADQYHFAVIVDETCSNFVNVDVLRAADVVVSSLTKIFSGDCNVMGGDCVLNPSAPFYPRLKPAMSQSPTPTQPDTESGYEDNYWLGDAIYMERNSRDFLTRIPRINANAALVCSTLQLSPIIKRVYYPPYTPDKPNYDAHLLPGGGYGGLLSITFRREEQAAAFFDAWDVAKGPSLGTNFTLACPFTILGHYGELEWAARWGVERGLVRVSVGLEDGGELVRGLERALRVAEALVDRDGDGH